MSKKPHVYRIGDKVRVVNPRWVRRVGYPLVWTEIEQEVRDMRRTQEAWATFQGIPLDFTCTLAVPMEVIKAFAKQVVIERRFGGASRSIYYDEPQTETPGTLHFGYARNCGQVLTVQSKRRVYTGVRVQGHYWTNSDGEDDGYDSYLDERKTHVLLTTESGEIEACDVEPA